MIYSINEGFFGKKPNKLIESDVKNAEERIKACIKYFDDGLKIITQMKLAVCKNNFTDSDEAKVKECMKKLANLEDDFKKKYSDRKLTVSVNSLIRKYNRTDVGDIEFPEGASEEYRALVKKVSANGQYTKQLTTIAHKFFKLSDEYTVMYNKRKELSPNHLGNVDLFGGMVGNYIGSIPVVKLGFGKGPSVE